jgi:hypothetical protein
MDMAFPPGSAAIAPTIQMTSVSATDAMIVAQASFVDVCLLKR